MNWKQLWQTLFEDHGFAVEWRGNEAYCKRPNGGPKFVAVLSRDVRDNENAIPWWKALLAQIP